MMKASKHLKMLFVAKKSERCKICLKNIKAGNFSVQFTFCNFVQVLVISADTSNLPPVKFDGVTTTMPINNKAVPSFEDVNLFLNRKANHNGLFFSLIGSYGHPLNTSTLFGFPPNTACSISISSL